MQQEDSIALDCDSLHDYIQAKARSYPENDWILAERDKQSRRFERQNKIIKLVCIFLLVTFLIFSLIYPQKSIELIRTLTNSASQFFTDLTRMFFSNYM